MKKLIFVSLLSIILLSACSDNVLSKKYLNIAHRGASGSAPEHTFTAYDKAITQKADYIELDLQMTKDNKLIAMHDKEVNSTTNGNGLVNDLSLSEIKALDAGSHFDSKFKHELVPELSEILKEYKDKTNFYIETKHPDIYPFMDEILMKDLESEHLLSDKNLKKGKVIIQSFSEMSLQNIHNLNEDIPLIKLIDDKDISNLTNAELERLANFAYGIGVNQKAVTKNIVKRAHNNGLKVHVFTLNNKNEALKMKKMGVDGGFNNNP